MSSHNNMKKHTSLSEKVSDTIARFAGSMVFVYIHIFIFALWIFQNIVSQAPWDPYPFIFLTLVVSLEAIFLSTFVLINQNKDFKRSEKRSELDYAADRETEKVIHEVKREILEIKELLKKK